MRLEMHTQRRDQLIDVTDKVAEVVEASGVQEGMALIYCSHTTAGVTINEAADPDVGVDLLAGLSRLAPPDVGWRHAEGNSDAHVKAALIGASAIVPIVAGRLALGTWQGIFFCEFDGPRRRSLSVHVTSGGHS
jgi:secondary thiamine-phosphate synthase enzyme